ncbi:transcriptional regulator with XRE-family HTH domain [Bacillus mesophilus]|uniref:Helix-turn-helix transcriptional regulator n=1 Tax=Bacillus mesophilus TaxID=1808955 RepID=A0A6M0QA93_9BACI|nr:helix-turn-helix transcriptional regulator [Bacillus mesophilus]MBM7662643.1 transcriptional regulator with XRE-family HTH domain [Bacillus mesophilus]NEY73291.1 helix-turn-helix transcriptional regulator [Bacillus mesophilus]
MEKEMIKSIRLHYNMTQRDFAKAINCSYSLIALVELGKRRVTTNLETKVKQKFGLTDQQISYINFLVEEIGKGMTPFI